MLVQNYKVLAWSYTPLPSSWKSSYQRISSLQLAQMSILRKGRWKQAGGCGSTIVLDGVGAESKLRTTYIAPPSVALCIWLADVYSFPPDLGQRTLRKYDNGVPSSSSTSIRAVRVHAEAPKMLTSNTLVPIGNSVECQRAEPNF